MTESPKYTCAQAELYAASPLIWESCGQHLPDFFNFKAKYTQEYVDQQVALIAPAESLPDEQTRNRPTEILSIQLSEKAAELRGEWQKLKRYIEEAYPENLQKPNLEAAGQGYYKAAGNDTWTAVKALFVAARNFINDHLGELQQQGYMPETFRANFNKLGDQFQGLYQNFLDSRENETIGAAAKVRANNDIYRSVIALCKDGQEIFKNDDALRAQFIFDEVIFKISGGGIAGLSGQVLQKDTKQPIADVGVSLSGSDKSTTTDSSGRYEIRPLAVGKYDVTFQLYPHLTVVERGIQVQTGVVARLNVDMA